MNQWRPSPDRNKPSIFGQKASVRAAPHGTVPEAKLSEMHGNATASAADREPIEAPPFTLHLRECGDTLPSLGRSNNLSLARFLGRPRRQALRGGA